MKSTLLLVPFLVGCATQRPPVSTEGLALNELSLQVIVDIDEQGTHATVGIYALGYDGYQRLELGPQDALTARVGDQPYLTFPSTNGLSGYAVDLPLQNGSFALDWRRGATVATTRVDLPAPFTLDRPVDGRMLLDRPFTLSWSPVAPGSPVRTRIKGPCVNAAERSLTADTGTFTWSAADFALQTTPAPPCTATLTVHRKGGAIAIAPELAGVQLFRAEQVRSLGLLSTFGP